MYFSHLSGLTADRYSLGAQQTTSQTTTVNCQSILTTKRPGTSTRPLHPTWSAYRPTILFWPPPEILTY